MVLLANSSTEYLQMWLEKGKLTVQVNNLKTVTGKNVVNDGEIHFVSITIQEGMITLQESDHVFEPMDVQPVSIQYGDVIYVGGLLDGRESSAFGGYFKGCLQDLELNEKKLEFFPLDASVMSYRPDRMVDVTAGCTSDDSCAVSFSVMSSQMQIWKLFTQNLLILFSSVILFKLDESLHS